MRVSIIIYKFLTCSKSQFMDKVYDLIGILNKEEIRHLKIFMGRTNNNPDRKDINLLDQVRKAYPDHDEEKLLKKLYDQADKNVFYRLKNRLSAQIDQSLSLQYFENSDEQLALNYLNLSRIFYLKRHFEISGDYLKKAEKKALAADSCELLDIIYSDFIKLSHEAGSINPEAYVNRRKQNRKDLMDLNQIDDVLAMLTYRIKVSQNFSKDQKLLDLLQNTINEFSYNEIQRSTQLRFKIYNAVSRILLQKNDFNSLEIYLLKTFKEFSKEKLFTRNNHDTKLQMITYIINSLFKNGKINQSLAFAEVLKSSILEYDKLLYDKYLFFYYNSLVINYSEQDKEKAVSILEEAKKEKAIQKLPVYTAFIYLNLSVLYFDLRQFKKALKSLVQMKLEDDYKNLDVAFRLKINLAELIIRYELNDYDLVEKGVSSISKEFGSLLKKNDFKNEKQLLKIVHQMIFSSNILSDKNLLTSIKELTKEKTSSSGDDIINFRSWLKEKVNP